MKLAALVIFSAVAALSGCSANIGTPNEAPRANQNTNGGQSTSANTANTAAANSAAATPVKAAAECKAQKMDGKIYIKAQSFPIDFKPYEGSCFVTFGSKEEMLDEKDVPRGSAFFIYKDNKQVAELPDAFGGSSACWIDGVSFKDLNGDGRTDIALAGSCLGARDSYPANAVYVNTGTAFTTKDDANARLETFKSVKDIEAFVKGNVKLFF